MQTQSRQRPRTPSVASLVALCLVSVIVTGCVTARPEPPKPTVVQPAACPQATAFGREFMKRVADEEEHLPDGAALTVVVDDWIKMRDQVRLCRNAAS